MGRPPYRFRAYSDRHGANVLRARAVSDDGGAAAGDSVAPNDISPATDAPDNSPATEPTDIDIDERPTRSVGRNIAALMASQSVTWVLATVVLWLIPHYLDADSLGQLRIANSFWEIGAVIASFGTATLLTVEVARNRPAVSDLVRRVLHLRFALFVVVTPIILGALVARSLRLHDRASRCDRRRSRRCSRSCRRRTSRPSTAFRRWGRRRGCWSSSSSARHLGPSPCWYWAVV